MNLYFISHESFRIKEILSRYVWLQRIFFLFFGGIEFSFLLFGWDERKILSSHNSSTLFFSISLTISLQILSPLTISSTISLYIFISNISHEQSHQWSSSKFLPPSTINFHINNISFFILKKSQFLFEGQTFYYSLLLTTVPNTKHF